MEKDFGDDEQADENSEIDGHDRKEPAQAKFHCRRHEADIPDGRSARREKSEIRLPREARSIFDSTPYPDLVIRRRGEFASAEGFQQAHGAAAPARPMLL
ncbi:hypothetical protein V3H18_14910 [Methylocystis sp. 9N]|uniref:AbrB/MazE/SpoVT family DNA-binding domain-containing protein n=1 Tax=Methylocystis borbori TaxID=3118750 RepID=A0ABU7XLA5_9HYPH